MRYEEGHSVGEISTTKEYEGTPEEIAKLISLLKTIEENETEVLENDRVVQ